MPEGNKHRELVYKIRDWILRKHGEGQCVFHSIDTPGENNPRGYQRFNGSLPDLFVQCNLQNNIGSKKYWIGEAEVSFTSTPQYRHAYNQIKNFLGFCENDARYNFILAVPWDKKEEATDLVKRVLRREKINYSGFVVIDDMDV